MAKREAPPEGRRVQSAGQSAPEQETWTAVEAEDGEEETGSRSKLYVLWVIVAVLVLLVMIAVVYGIMSQSHKDRFPDNTYLNGMDVSGMTAAKARNALAKQAETYTLTIVERDGVTETITADQIDLTYTDNGDVDELLASYNPYRWLLDRFRTDELTAGEDTSMDEELAREAVESLTCLTDWVPMSNAQLVLDEDQERYVVAPEVYGTQLDLSQAYDAIYSALETRASEVDLEALGLYASPTVFQDDPDLNAEADRLNGLLSACVTLDFGDDRIVTVDAGVIAAWLEEDENGQLNLSYDLAYDFVKTNIAYKMDTFGLTHEVTIHTGQTIRLTGGDYGWCLARGDTTQTILDAVEQGLTVQVEPSWQYKAQNLGIDDIGGTYIEISISEQMMWCYKDYQVVVETPVVTGNVNQGNGTPYGSVWAIDGMTTDAVLGTMDTMGYESPVNFWMPFTGNVGIHDADGWRSSYGGTIYLSNGSHGCVNTPLEAMRTIYHTVTVVTAVVVYDLDDPDTVIVHQYTEDEIWDDEFPEEDAAG